MAELIVTLQGWVTNLSLVLPLLLLVLAGLLQVLAYWGSQSVTAGARPTAPASPSRRAGGDINHATRGRATAVGSWGGLAPVGSSWVAVAMPIGCTALAKGLLLVLVPLVGVRVLGVSEPMAWLPTRTGTALLMAVWLALVLYLIVDHWWRARALALALPWVLLPWLAAAEWLPDGLVTRGLTIMPAGRSVYGLLASVALALTTLAWAGWLAQWLEEWGRGGGRRSAGWLIGLLSGATTLMTIQVGLVAVAWLGRRGGLPPWTLQTTWLAGGWVVVLLATLLTARGRSGAGPSIALAVLLLGLSLAIVAGVGRPTT